MCLNFRCSPADGADGDSGQKKSVCCHGGLPWWFIFVGWLLVIGTSVVSGYFTMLYGLKFGKERSINWLVSMIVSFFQSTLIIQPLKVRTLLHLLGFNITFLVWLFSHSDNEEYFMCSACARNPAQNKLFSLVFMPLITGAMLCSLLCTCNKDSWWGRFSKCGIWKKQIKPR